MRKLRALIVFMLSVAMVFTLNGCGKSKDLKKYNAADYEMKVDKISEESVIKNAVLAESFNSIKEYEIKVSTYIELGQKKRWGNVTHYIVATCAGFGFENDKLTRIKGTALPSAIIITLKNTKDGYSVVGYSSSTNIIEPKDKEKFFKKHFPKEFIKSKNNLSDYREELINQEKEQAQKNPSIAGREFELNDDVPEIELLPITDDAYNAVSKYFNNYPDYIGNFEKIEGKVRYVYETAYAPESEEHPENGLLSFIKRKYNGEVVSKIDIPIKGNIVELPKSTENKKN
ncbi:MAG: hypothetical protein Q8873_06020 [Bacillota bacterium]|nr:hypothetical protein [Bacillota bacterium]